jgi:soluble lytic murein transglycosylase-like protein
MDDAATLSAPELFNHIRFGPYYPAQVVPISAPYGFHPLFVWSVMRQESLFEGFIDSSVGAQGLMQIMPTTAESIVNRLAWPPNYTSVDLYRPLVSLRLGLDYLAQQRDQFGSGTPADLFVALAAYNGGPGNAAIWKELAQGDPTCWWRSSLRRDAPLSQIYLRDLLDLSPVIRSARPRNHQPQPLSISSLAVGRSAPLVHRRPPRDPC